jgi:excisionase family DNA binding protein
VSEDELTSQQVADILNVSLSRVVKLVSDEILPCKMVDNRYRFSAADVAAINEMKRLDEFDPHRDHTKRATRPRTSSFAVNPFTHPPRPVAVVDVCVLLPPGCRAKPDAAVFDL